MCAQGKGVSLPMTPKDHDYEDLIAADYQIDGYYIERNIVEEQILELDVISTQYSSSDEAPELTLIEVKSGNWGFGDVFKISGWKHYLCLEKAKLIVQKQRDDLEFYVGKSRDMGIEIEVIETPRKDTPEDIWRYSYLLERKLVAKLKAKKKAEGDKACYRAIDKYYTLTNSGIFFTPSILERLGSLYGTYMKYPNLSARTGHELMGDDFEEEHGEIPGSLFNDTFYKALHTDINISTFIEYRSRLSILKCAVDYLLYKNVGDTEKAKDSWKIRFGGREMEVNLEDDLPCSFRDGLAKLKASAYFHRYPVFWQWFMWFFGGFILVDYKDEEYELLSEKSGVPPDHVEEALGAFDFLFPLEHGRSWLVAPTEQTNIRHLRLFCTPFMGIGAYLRKDIHGAEDYGGLRLTKQYTCQDLIRWNNLAVDVLGT